MACSQPEDSDESPHQKIERELDGLINKLAFSREDVLTLLSERRTAFEELLETAGGDVLWRRDCAVSTDEASYITTCLSNAWSSFRCALRDVDRPLQLAERAARRLLVIPEEYVMYNAAADIDIEQDELLYRINECRRSEFWRRVACRFAGGRSLPVPRGERRRTQIVCDLLHYTIKQWTVAFHFLNRHMNEAQFQLGKVSQKLHEISKRTCEANNLLSRELDHLANDLRQTLISINRTVDIFEKVKSTLSNIHEKAANEINGLY